MSTQPPKPPKTVPRWLDLSAHFPVGGTIEHPKFATYHDKTGVLDAPVTLANANSQKGALDPKFDRICVHWTAGGPLLPYDDYHFCQVMDTDDEPAMVRCVAKGHKGQHLYRRNTGAAGFSWCAAGPGSVGAVRLQQMAKIVGEFCHKHGLDPLGKTHDGFNVIDDHAAYAKVDYPGQRWDVGSQLPNLANGKPDPRNLMLPLRKAAAWYYSKVEVVAGKPVYEYAAIL